MHELHIREKKEETENRGCCFPKLALKIVFWTHFQEGDVIIFQKFQSMHKRSTKRLVLPMDSFSGQNHRYCLLSTASSPSIAVGTLGARTEANLRGCLCHDLSTHVESV